MAQPTYSFTAIGFLLLGIAGLVLAGNEKTGPIVIYILLLMILLILLINYKRITSVVFQKE